MSKPNPAKLAAIAEAAAFAIREAYEDGLRDGENRAKVAELKLEQAKEELDEIDEDLRAEEIQRGRALYVLRGLYEAITARPPADPAEPNDRLRRAVEEARKLLDAASVPDEICACGDYRRDHENGTGRCSMPDDLCHGFKPCKRFRPCG